MFRGLQHICIIYIFMAWSVCFTGGTAAGATINGRFTLSGTVVNARTKAPVEFASVILDNGERWTITDEQGVFLLKNVPAGDIALTVSCLGYAKQTLKRTVSGDMSALIVYLAEDNLQLKEVIISARRHQEEATTAYVIDRASLAHLQMLNVADAMSLLPGGQTNKNLHLATGDAQYITVRNSAGSEDGNPTFGTAVEVDGVRLSHNATFSASTASRLYGIDTRTITTTNVESIEVVTGIPSVQYGDLSNGMVKINTVRGKSPLQVDVSTKPHTKQVALHKGFAPGHAAGVFNVAGEYTRSIADPASPYTSYVRQSLSLRYSNTFNRSRGQPLTLETGITGTLGGYHSEGDPDAFVDTWKTVRGNTLRGNVRLSWLPDRWWLTNFEGQFAVYYADNREEVRSNKSSSSSVAAVHGLEEGYFVATRYDDNPAAAIVLIPPGYWYQTAITDSKPIDISGHLKGNWTRAFGHLRNTILAGTEFSSAGNLGCGLYYDDLRYAPSGWRPYRFDAVSWMNNIAWYVEDRLQWPIGRTYLLAVAGIRSDRTLIQASRYGSVSSLSPRFNIRYRLIDRPTATWMQRLTLTTGWGKAVKLPSFEALYPRPHYKDILSFAPGTMADGTSFIAYYIMPHTTTYNPDLRWQQSQQWEAGIEARIWSVNVSLSFFYHQTIDPYIFLNAYTPFAYKLTGQEALEQSAIPSVDRQYNIDRTTGIVTVIDRTGAHAPETLAYRERRTFRYNNTITNGTPFARRGVEWVVDFGKISPLQTAVRFDGQYYHYRSVKETIVPYSPTEQTMADGNPYKYIGYYVGDAAAANGAETRKVNTNLTLTTHIPAIRIILSLRIESCLYNYTQNLSEYSGGERGFAVDNRPDDTPAADPSRYNTDRYVAVYPLYYTTYDDMQTKIPFAETFLWAKANKETNPEARTLYNELSKLIERTNTDYYFNANKISAYYSLNLSVTKELGDRAVLAFSATNFTNNAQQVTMSETGSQLSAYNSARNLIPRFYYSLSLKIKW
ncbi:MAG: TonB-dependent receptor [Prevotellaceae bacterium]|jgi:hypothetical protein|nr:TonB-dependent receptor [Prevotellaceae bacterium]